MSTFTIKEHDALTGITTTVNRTENAVQFVKTYDAEPFLEHAAAARAATADPGARAAYDGLVAATGGSGLALADRLLPSCGAIEARPSGEAA